jgi:hypothetical protein
VDDTLTFHQGITNKIQPGSSSYDTVARLGLRMLLEMIYRRLTVKFVPMRNATVLTVDENPYFDKGRVSHEEEQGCNVGPSSRPDERDFLRKYQEVVINLVRESDPG